MITDTLHFHPITIADKQLLLAREIPCRGMNCDLNFMNIFSWQFLYHTEMAEWRRHLIIRFVADGHTAYMTLFDETDFNDLVEKLLAEAELGGHPFLAMGVCENTLPLFEAARPDFFTFEYDRNYCDYIYQREDLASLAGKKLQSKRNFVNRFKRLYPDYVYRPLTSADIPACLALDKEWMESHDEQKLNERQSIKNVFSNWDELGGLGGVIYVGDQLAAFTYGAPINGTIFDVCVEKASPDYEGAYAIINKEFVSHLPEQFTLINREEDLGVEGLRRAKLSYQPSIILRKYAVMIKHHFCHGAIR